MTEELGEGAGATQQQKLPQDAAPQEKKAGGPFASLKRMPASLLSLSFQFDSVERD